MHFLNFFQNNVIYYCNTGTKDIIVWVEGFVIYAKESMYTKEQRELLKWGQ